MQLKKESGYEHKGTSQQRNLIALVYNYEKSDLSQTISINKK